MFNDFFNNLSIFINVMLNKLEFHCVFLILQIIDQCVIARMIENKQINNNQKNEIYNILSPAIENVMTICEKQRAKYKNNNENMYDCQTNDNDNDNDNNSDMDDNLGGLLSHEGEKSMEFMEIATMKQEMRNNNIINNKCQCFLGHWLHRNICQHPQMFELLDFAKSILVKLQLNY